MGLSPIRFSYKLLRSAAGRIRTLNPQSRNLVFYPVELRLLKEVANIRKRAPVLQEVFTITHSKPQSFFS